MPLTWGIVSAGKICHDFVTSMSVLPEGHHKVVAVGARSLESAKKFAKAHNIPRAYEGYSKIAEDSDIDVVYIGNLNPQHFEVVKMMLEHNKNVLCEKPMTMYEKHTRELVELARMKKLFLMEAVWSRCFPVYAKLQQLLESRAIGDVVHVSATFGDRLQHVERLNSKEMGGGTILDLGVYALQFQQLVFRGLQPIRVVADGHLNKGGVDESASAILIYSGGRTAVVSTSARAQFPNEGVIIGTEGIIRVPKFWCPTQLVTPDGTLEFSLPPGEPEQFVFDNSVGLSYEAEHVRECLINGMVESPKISHQESIQLAHLMDTWRKQIRVVFAED